MIRICVKKGYNLFTPQLIRKLFIFLKFFPSSFSYPSILRTYVFCFNAEWGIRSWEKRWCGSVAKAQRTVFVCVANIWWTAKRYLFGVGISKKSTFAMLGVRSTRQMPNKPLFGIHSGSPQSCMPHSHLHTDVDTPWHRFKFLSHDQEEEHVSCPASLRVPVNNFKNLKRECTCAPHAQWYSVHTRITVHASARGSENSGKIVG